MVSTSVEDLDTNQISLFHPVRARTPLVDNEIERSGGFMVRIIVGRRVDPPPERNDLTLEWSQPVFRPDRGFNPHSTSDGDGEIGVVLHPGIPPSTS